MKRVFKKLATIFLATTVVLAQGLVLSKTSYAADAANLAIGKSIVANNYTQTYVATNANDGNVNTYWEGSSYPSTLTVDLGAVQSVNKVVLKLNPDSAWAKRTQTLSVLGSSDNSTYNTLVASTTYTFDPATGNSVTINFSSTSQRYVRLNITANSGATGGQVAEFEVYGAGTTTGTPDLVVTDITWNPASPATNNEVTFSAVIKNQGTAATQAGVKHGLSLLVDGTQVNWCDSFTSSIPAGGTATLTANGGPSGKSTWTATSGTHTVRAFIDDVNLIAESNENNNTLDKSITVSSTTPPPSGNKYEGEAATLSGGAKINTDHTGYSGSGFVDGIQTSGSSQASFTVNAASAGYYDVDLRYANAYNGNPMTLSVYVNGSKVRQTSLPALADWNTWGDKIETLSLNAGNNTIAYKYDTTDTGNVNIDYITVNSSTTDKADLVVTGLTFAPTNPTAGQTVTFTATVKNQGAAATTAGLNNVVGFNIGSTKVTGSTTASIPVGGTATVTGTWTSVAGTFTPTANVDDSNVIIESNETNNSYTSTTQLVVTAPTKPDLVVTNISWAPSNPQAGNTVTLTATVKNQGAATTAGVTNVVGFNIGSTKVTGSTTASIATGGTIAVTASYTAVAGSYAVSANADDTNVFAELDETNNSYTSGSQMVVTTPPAPGSRGATVPYTRYESEDGTLGGGAVLRTAPTFDYSLIASEASNQKYVALPTNGSYVEWTVNQGGAGVDMRFTMPDTADGMGLNGSLDCYVNGTKVSTISLTSYYSWQYFTSDQPADAPNGGQAAFRFDETHFKLSTALKAGDKIRIQKTNGDSIEYGVDFLEIEPVPAAIAKPANALSVTDYGATPNDSTDDLAAFNSCVNAAASSGKSVYIPEGKFNLGGMWTINANNITITGAGMWYTNIQFTSPNSASGGISLRVTGTIDFSNVYMNSMLRTRYNQNAIYKAFMDNFGTNSRIHDFWEEHFECGFWVADYAHTPAIPADGLIISNGRVRNNLADGINFCQGTKNSTVQNCSVRNNGDDGLAMWPDSTMGAPMEVNNTFSYNTIENNWRAAAIAIFGGSGHKATNNYIKDCFMGSGIRMNTVFPGYHFENNTGITFSDTTIINSGTSKDCYNGERGAIDLEASNSSIQNVTFTNIDIINAQRDAIQFGYGGGFSNINFNNITIDGTGKDNITTSRFSQPHLGEAIYTYTGNGSATFTNLSLSNIEATNPYLIQSGFNLTVK
ncbi:glycosyl hydrolase [Clostridium zeae]|uniref:Glycosyl hydrolase n=1 Tax=Clostridium zeae TaxID=2759022 RepID=A0ABQ1EG08_9CLOT|nr:CARDB domain-containing protein [Clostridium zeae]GFZ33598.1 glycosyl hydrolase [Clostridium zeae]